MPRKYVPRLGARSYSNYPPKTLASALRAVNQNEMSIREASRQYRIPFGTLYNKVKGLHMKKIGSPTVLTTDQEEELSVVIKITGDWGYPLQPTRVSRLVKEFLDHNGIKTKFPGNRPGPDWISYFMKRNHLTTRWTQNIKRSRAKVSPDTINTYFDNLAYTLRDVPKENIINYDETNFTDDPESQRVIVRRGQKHVDRVLDHSKSSYSVMFAGCADGKTLPPYVVYAALHLYPTWIAGGPKGTRFNRTKSGWFDAVTFEDWFFTIVLPYCKKLDNDKPKVILGDNVASHMSLRVIKTCLENNIKFVMLPPNSTHLCQPLDVAYFRPLKKAWRCTLMEWKERNKGCVPKHIFPRLLKQTLDSIEHASNKNMKAGFEASGIHPLNRYAVLKRIPGGNKVAPSQSTNSSFSEQLITMLKEERFGQKDERQIPKKHRLVDVQPGASVSERDLIAVQKKVKVEGKENIAAVTIKEEPKDNAGKKQVTGRKQRIIKQKPTHEEVKKQGTKPKKQKVAKASTRNKIRI